MNKHARQRIVDSYARLNHSTSIQQTPSHTQATGNRIVDSDTMYDNCPTCELLWQEFSEATKAHAAILAKGELSETEQNSDIVKELELVKLATAERHAKARMALREHVAANQHEKA